MEFVASLSQGRTAAAQCGLFTYKSVPVIFEPPCIYSSSVTICLPESSAIRVYINRAVKKAPLCTKVRDRDIQNRLVFSKDAVCVLFKTKFRSRHMV